MGVVNKDGALMMAIGVDPSDLNQGLNDAEQRIDKFGKNAQKMGESLSKGLDISKQIEVQKKVISDLEKEYVKVNKSLEEMSDKYSSNHLFSDKEIAELTKQYNTAKKLVDESKSSLDGEKKSLEDLEKQYQKIAKEEEKLAKQQAANANKQITTLQQIRKVTEEMRLLRGADGIVAPENIQRYDELKKKLSELGTSYRIVQQEQKDMTTKGNAHITGLIQGITGLSGAFAAGQGIASLFVKNNEKLAEIQTKLQAAMSITIGLQQVSNTLHATSSFRINTVTKATQLWNAAVKVLNVNLGLSAALSKGLVGLGIGALIAGVVVLISKYREWSAEQERKNKLLKEEQEVLREANKNVNENLIRVKALEKVLKDSNEAYSKRNLALNELKSIMPEYNAQLSKEGELIKDNTGALKKYVQELKNSALAKIYVDKFAKAQNDYDEWMDNLNPVEKAIRNLSDEDLKKTRFDANSDWERLRKEEIEHLKAIKKWDEKAQEYIGKDLSSQSLIEGTKPYWQKIKTDAENSRALLKDTEKDSKKWLKLTETIKNAEGKLKAWESPTKADAAGESAAKKALKQSQKVSDEELKLENDTIKAKLDSRNSRLEIRQEEINLMEDSFAKEQAQAELNHDKELLAIDKRTQDLIEKEQERRRKLWDIANPNGSKTPYKTNVHSILDLAVSDQGDIESSENIANKKQLKATEDLLKQLLAKYQDYNAQRFEIDKKYQSDLNALNTQLEKDPDNPKIKNAIAQLQKDWKKALSSINLDEFQDQIDWSVVFSNLDKVSTDELIRLKDKLKDYLSEVGKSLSPQDLKTVTDAFENLNDKISEKRPIDELKASYEEYGKALKSVIEAKKELAKYEKDTPRYTTAVNNLTAAENKLHAARTKMAKAVTNTTSKVREYLEVANEFVSTLETMGISVSDSTKQTLEGFGQILDGADKMAQGWAEKNPAKIMQGVIEQTKGYFNAISGIFGGGDNNRYAEMKAQYDRLNEVWDQLIDKKKEYLKISYGEEAQRVGEEAIELQKKAIESNRILGKEYLGSGASKGSHSYGRRQKKNMSDEGWAELDEWRKKNNISDTLYDNVTQPSMYGLFDLSVEQLEKLKEDAPTFWAKLHSEVQEYLNNIISGSEKIEEINNAIKEQLTQVSFDSVFDSFVDTLMNMDSSSKDFADNFSKYLQKAILSSLVADKYRDRLKQWYENFAKANEDGNIDAKEYADLQSEYDKIVNEAIKDRDALKDLMKWEDSSSSSQQASKGLFETMSQDTASALEGRFTALQMSGVKLEEYTLQLILLVSENNNVLKTLPSTFQEFRNIFLAIMYDIQDIKKSNNELYTINAGIREMNKKLESL